MIANMSSEALNTPAELFNEWREEDRDLDAYIDELRGWMREVNQLGIPHFGEAAARLTSLRSRLMRHFEREHQIIASLANHFSGTDSALETLKAHAQRDHAAMLNQLDELMQRLNQLDPPFCSWLAAMEEIEAFVSRLWQHERLESGYVSTILAADDDLL